MQQTPLAVQFILACLLKGGLKYMQAKCDRKGSRGGN